MKHLKRIDEAVGTILERRASAESLLKMVAKGDSKDVEGIKLSKEMADAFLDWLRGSTYGKKFGALPFYKLFTASFNWGLSRYTTSKELKKEYKELNVKAKEMSKAEMNKESLDEAQSWNSIAKIMDAGIKKAIKSGSVPLSYAKDYVKSLERMAKTSKKKFFDEYGNFSEDDFIEDVEYNMANESVINENDAKTIVKAFMNVYDKRDEVTADDWEQFIYDWSVMGDGGTMVHGVSYDTIDDVLTMLYKKGYKKIDDEAIIGLYESINEAKFSFSEDEVKDVAEVIAKALAKMDNMKTAVHDMEYDAGRGAGFEISMGGDKYEGGSYVVKPNGDVINAAIGNSFPNAVYANIGDTDIKKVMKKIKKFESVTEAEDFKPHMMYDPETGDEYKAEKPEDHERMAKLGYVHEKPESTDENKVNESSGSEERRIALRAIKSIAKYLNRDLPTSAQYLLNATEDVQRDIKKGKIK